MSEYMYEEMSLEFYSMESSSKQHNVCRDENVPDMKE